MLTWAQPTPANWPIKPDPLPPILAGTEHWWDGPALWGWAAIILIAIVREVRDTWPTGKLWDGPVEITR